MMYYMRCKNGLNGMKVQRLKAEGKRRRGFCPFLFLQGLQDLQVLLILTVRKIRQFIMNQDLVNLYDLHDPKSHHSRDFVSMLHNLHDFMIVNQLIL
jgi:hypothetical protein